MNITRLFKCGLCAAVAFASFSLRAATLNVFAAASLTDVLRDVARDYQKRTGDKIDFNFAGSSLLARQIEEGAPADIFFSADEKWMDALEQKGLIVKSSRKDRLSNSLVIVLAPGITWSIGSPVGLLDARISHLALADPKAVPAGLYAKEYLTGLHLWERLAPKVVPMSNVRAALAAVESGDAEAGIVYKTDAAISKKVRVVYEVPLEKGPKISYPMAVLRDSPSQAAATAFLFYLDSNAAGRVFEKHGFIVNPSKP